jgi:hypothetical protein
LNRHPPGNPWSFKEASVDVLAKRKPGDAGLFPLIKLPAIRLSRHKTAAKSLVIPSPEEQPLSSILSRKRARK